MGVVWKRSAGPGQLLRREVELPLPTMGRSPMAIAGLCLVFVFVAAMVDALLWQASSERDQLRARAQVAEERVVELEMQLEKMELERAQAAEAGRVELADDETESGQGTAPLPRVLETADRGPLTMTAGRDRDRDRDRRPRPGPGWR
jgi:hypothetical protein